MKQFCTEFKIIDPNGYGIISTFIYKGKDWEQAESKACKAFDAMMKKRHGINLNDVEFIGIVTNEFKPGFFSERSWVVR